MVSCLTDTSSLPYKDDHNFYIHKSVSKWLKHTFSNFRMHRVSILTISCSWMSNVFSINSSFHTSQTSFLVICLGRWNHDKIFYCFPTIPSQAMVFKKQMIDYFIHGTQKVNRIIRKVTFSFTNNKEGYLANKLPRAVIFFLGISIAYFT